jgi:tetratricopeptide (TPR) repeat protein
VIFGITQHDALFNLGCLYAGRKEYDDALRELKSSLAIVDNNKVERKCIAPALNQLGEVYRAQGNYLAAKEVLWKAAKYVKRARRAPGKDPLVDHDVRVSIARNVRIVRKELLLRSHSELLGSAKLKLLEDLGDLYV